MQTTENQNEWINRIEESISKRHIKYYAYKYFSNIKEINSEGFGKVFRVKWKNSEQYLSLKSFKTFDNATAKELVHELNLRRDVDFHNNIIRFYGITTTDQGKTKEYLLVTEYADSGSLQTYLKENFNRLTWNDKYKLAFQLASTISYLHDEGIMHLNLHSKSILIHQNTIKLADFGLAKRIEEASKNRSKSFSNIPYIDPKRLTRQKYKLDKKSDVYSIGVLLWEISSGKPPFSTKGAYDIGLIYEISQGARENPIPDTPDAYVKLYTECWNKEPNNRPTMTEVVDRLKNYQKDNLKHEQQQSNVDKIKYSDFPSNGIDRMITNGLVDCLNKKERIDKEIVKPLSTMVNEIITKKNEESDDVSQGIYDLLNNQHDPNSFFEKLNDSRIGTSSCKEAVNLVSEFEDAVGRNDTGKVVGLLMKSAEGAMTNILQNSYDNDEQVLEVVESCKEFAEMAQKLFIR